MQTVSKIACENNGGFVMRFRVKWGNGKQMSDWTDNYPIGQSKTMDLNKLGIPEGTECWPEADARLGGQKDAKKHVVFDPNSNNVATYRVSGTTFDIKIDLLD